MSWTFFKRYSFRWIQGWEEIHPNPLVELVANEPMARREFLDQYERLPLWMRAIFRVRVWAYGLFG